MDRDSTLLRRAVSSPRGSLSHSSSSNSLAGGSHSPIINGSNSGGATPPLPITSASGGVATTTPSSSWRSQYETLWKEFQQYRHHVELLEKQNADLKRSVLQLSLQLTASSSGPGIIGLADSSCHKSATGSKTPPPALTSSTSAAAAPVAGNVVADSVAVMSAPGSSATDENIFKLVRNFKGHTGAVYVTRFSSNSNTSHPPLVLSAGLDKRLLVWNPSSSSSSFQMEGTGHAGAILAATWLGTQRILTGSVDQTVRIWDVLSASSVTTHSLPGLVHATDALSDNLIVAGTSSGAHVVDLRTNESTIVVADKTDITAVAVARNNLWTGDRKGVVTVWDPRNTSTPLFNVSGGRGTSIATTRDPISNISKTKDDVGGEFVSVNCFDNVARVYDSLNATLVNWVTGHRNKNWPIHGAVYQSNDDNFDWPKNSRSTSSSSSVSSDDSDEDADNGGGDNTETHRGGGNRNKGDRKRHRLFATGSADAKIYVYECCRNEGQQSRLIETIAEHSDRVYSVDFHPTEPVIASASADNTVKLWSPNNSSNSLTTGGGPAS